MMNTNYKPGGGQGKIVSNPVRKAKPRTKSEGSEPPGKAKEDEKEDSEEKPKQKKSRRSDLKDLKARVAAKRSMYSRAWAAEPAKSKNKEADGESKKEDAEDTSDNKSNGEKKEEAEEVGNSKESDKEEEEKNSEVELSPSHIP